MGQGNKETDNSNSNNSTDNKTEELEPLFKVHKFSVDDQDNKKGSDNKDE